MRHLVSVLATGFVLFTLLVQATTLRSLIHWLGVDQLDPVERILRTRALALTQGEILDRLSETAIIHGLDLEAADEVGALYRKRVETAGGIGRGRRGHAAPAAHRGPGHDHRPRGLLLHRRDGRGDDLAHRRLAPARAGPTSCSTRSSDGSVQPYRKAARAEIGRDYVMQIAGFLHRRLRLNGPLARRMAQRIELRLIQRRVLEGLIGFIRNRIRALFGERVSEVALHVIEARIDDTDRALDAVRLQYPAYWRIASGRFLSRTAVRLELEAYNRMAGEGLLSPELLRHLVGELRTRLRDRSRPSRRSISASTSTC